MNTEAEKYNEQGRQAANYSNFTEAENCFLKAISLSPETAKYYLNLGRVQLYTEKHEAAEVNIKKALSVEPENTRCHLVLGEFYNKTGEKDLALEAFNKVLELDPNNGEAFYNIGQFYQEFQEYQLAVEYYSKSIESGYDSADPYVSRAIVYTNHLKEYVKALQDLDKAEEIEPDNEMIPMLRIPAAFNLGNKDVYDKTLKRVDESFEKHDKKKN
ncbi:MAG: tetratricopeptide repeat protein [Bacteroidetes bacterium]|nr:tetratricopeptide repeat protein [Bacteroidota bacterium]